ncbi:hypothetical protein BZM27_23110 [Paraburkholderia steynii]|uniref:Uncharacterized protein n=1 Tax=Paraburkholderia steynii TaxID=1245441 RepID=A0A4V2NH00_9BURK|nr:hypothetical protein BZM27_23110 [Paraburkholderia steynii]
MNTAQHSLRALVDKWLAPTAATPAHVTRFSRMSSNHRRFVSVETTRRTGTTIFFFRHDDGWCVFPPSTQGPTIGGSARTPAG